MARKVLAGLLALLLLGSAAVAEVYEGTVVANQEIPIAFNGSGRLKEWNVICGQSVSAGDVLARMDVERVFASQDGTIARIEEGDGTISLELVPVERYQIHCTVDGAYESAASTLVHAGEKVYIRCKRDGSHWATGIITQIDGMEYRVLTTGGELYVGEAVNLYRDADFASKQRIGIGTVVRNDVERYEVEGETVRLHVAEGELVQRGELLLEYAGSSEIEQTACVDGVITQVLADAGDALEADQTIAMLMPASGCRVELRIEEAALGDIREGAEVLLRTAAEEEEMTPAIVTHISRVAQEGLYTVHIVAQGKDWNLGSSIECRFSE